MAESPKREAVSSSDLPTPIKKIKTAEQTFLPSYHQRYPCLVGSRKGKNYAHCTLCKRDFSVKHGGTFDCKRHVESRMHKDFENDAAMQTSLSGFFGKPPTSASSLEQQVIKSEAIMCHFIAQENHSLASADKLVRTVVAMCPDSEIAKKLRCGRNKATAMIQHLAQSTKLSLTSRMKSGPFTLSTDGSNDAEAKQFPLVIRSINEDTGLVASELLSIPTCQGSATGENIFRLIEGELKAYGIPWANCLSLGCDNANVMTGKHKGVYAFVKQHQPSVFLAGCTLHVVHNSAKKAATHLPAIETVLIDIFHFFEKSVERQLRFKGTQKLYDVEQRKMLKHVPTRWLSIGRCLDRLLESWDPLKEFFSEEQKAMKKATKATSSYAAGKVDVIFCFVRSPTNKLYVLFLAHTIKMFEPFLLTFQAEQPLIHQLKKGMEKLLRSILCKFVKPAAFHGSTSVLDVDYKDPTNIKGNSELVIGEEAHQFLQNKTTNHLKDSRVEEFYTSVKAYFVELVDYLKSRLPLEDPVLQHAEVADVASQCSSSVADIRFFLERFPSLLPPNCTLNTITEQFSLYQATDISSCHKDRIDDTWKAIGELEGGQFKELSLVMRGIVTIPHSSAHCERIFSCVRKNRTDQRSSLADTTLESLLVLKSVPHEPAEAVQNLTAKDLAALKSAYSKKLSQ